MSSERATRLLQAVPVLSYFAVAAVVRLVRGGDDVAWYAWLYGISAAVVAIDMSYGVLTMTRAHRIIDVSLKVAGMTAVFFAHTPALRVLGLILLVISTVANVWLAGASRDSSAASEPRR